MSPQAARVLDNGETTLHAAHPMPTEQREPSLVPAYAAFAVVCIFWGTTFAAIRVAIETVPTLLVSGFRFAGAGAIMLVIALASGARFPKTRADWIGEVVDGLLMFGFANTIVVWSEHHMTSGLAALLAATIPIWMALLEAMKGYAPLTSAKVGALTLGFGGVALLVAPAIGRPDVSILFFVAVVAMQINAVVWNVGTLRSKKRRLRVDGTAASAVQMLAAGAALMVVAAPAGAYRDLVISPRSGMAMVYLILFGSVFAYSAYVYALRHLPAGKVSSYAYVNPAVAVILGALLLAEPVTIRMVVAMLVILAGVAMIQLDRRKIEKGAA